MASHHSDNEEEEVSNGKLSYDNYSQGAIDELLNQCKTLYKTLSTQKKKILSLEEKIDTIQKDFDKEKKNYFDKEKHNFICNECDSLSFPIFQLKRVIERYKIRQIGLEDILSRQRYSNK